MFYSGMSISKPRYFRKTSCYRFVIGCMNNLILFSAFIDTYSCTSHTHANGSKEIRLPLRLVQTKTDNQFMQKLGKQFIL